MTMVGRLTASERLPASLRSASNNRTRVGMSNSPPATPHNAATILIPTPATTPARV